jgi:hypothetical protein
MVLRPKCVTPSLDMRNEFTAIIEAASKEDIPLTALR